LKNYTAFKHRMLQRSAVRRALDDEQIIATHVCEFGDDLAFRPGRSMLSAVCSGVLAVSTIISAEDSSS
jgi:hypothetical protein